LDWVIITHSHLCTVNHGFADKIDNVSKAPKKESENVFFYLLDTHRMWQNSAKNSELGWALINAACRLVNMVTLLDALSVVTQPILSKKVS